MCECYVVGGPFIGVDPDCPIHNTKHRDYVDTNELDQLRAQLAELDARIKKLEQQIIDGDREFLRQEDRWLQRITALEDGLGDIRKKLNSHAEATAFYGDQPEFELELIANIDKLLEK